MADRICRKLLVSPSIVIRKRDNFYLKILAENKEKSLEVYILMCSKMYHGLNYQQLQKLAFEFAEKPVIIYPHSWKKIRWQEEIGCMDLCNATKTLV